MSQTEFIEHFTGFGLYDRSFILLLRELHDSSPFLRGIVAEYGHSFNRIEVPYRQEKRRAGKTKNNFYSLSNAVMLSITSYTKVRLRFATFVGFLFSGISLLGEYILNINSRVINRPIVVEEERLNFGEEKTK